MKITLLGTAAAEGWPGLFCECEACRRAREAGGKNLRARSSCLIGDEYMVDFGPDSYAYVLRHGVELSRVRHLLVTHSHYDHFYPEGLRMRGEPFAHLDESATLKVYGNAAVGRRLGNVRCNWQGDSGGIVFRRLRPLERVRIGEARVTPLPADHKEDEESLLYLFELGGRQLLYGHDSGYFPEAAWKGLAGASLDCVLLDCTAGPEPVREGHMGLPANREVRRRLLEEGMAEEHTEFVVTHFSHNGGMLHEELGALARPYGFRVAYDGMELSYPEEAR